MSATSMQRLNRDFGGRTKVRLEAASVDFEMEEESIKLRAGKHAFIAGFEAGDSRDMVRLRHGVERHPVILALRDGFTCLDRRMAHG